MIINRYSQVHRECLERETNNGVQIHQRNPPEKDLCTMLDFLLVGFGSNHNHNHVLLGIGVLMMFPRPKVSILVPQTIP